MNRKKVLVPALTTLLFSTAILGNTVAAEEVTVTTASDATVEAAVTTVDDTTTAAVATTEVTAASDAAVTTEDAVTTTSEEVVATVAETTTDATSSEATETVVAETNETAEVTATADATTETTTESVESTVDTTTTSTASSEATTSETAASETANSETTVTTEVTILHTNDIHGRIEEASGVIGMAKLATVVEETRQTSESTIVLDAGDAFQGLPISNSTKGEDMANLLNLIGYDAMAVGNHEFDFGLDQARKYKELLNFPLLSANTYVEGARLFEASTIIDKDTTIEGDEFVVIGVTTPETATKTHPNNVVGVTFTEPIDEVKTVIAEIEARATAEGKTYNNYIILGHLGVDNTTPTEWQGSTLAQALSEYELLEGKTVIVIDGHSHTVASTTYGNVTYNQTGSYLNNIGYITLQSNQVLEASVISAQEVIDNGVEADAEIAALVEEIRARYEAENATVIVENNPVTLSGDRADVRVRQTNLGDAVADALYVYGQTGFTNASDLAVTNGGGLRETLVAGEAITKGDVIAVLPFGNTISQIAVTGSQIEAMFEKSLGSIHQTDADGNTVLDENGNPLLEPSGGFLQVSGAQVYYDTNLEAGSRVLAIKILDRTTGEYVDLDSTATYYLVTNDFLAAGGDGYDMLGGTREEGPSMDVAFADYLATADLTQYEVVNPNDRTISIDSTLDSDGDGVVDYVELVNGTDAQDAASYPGSETVDDSTNTDVVADDAATVVEESVDPSALPDTAAVEEGSATETATVSAVTKASKVAKAKKAPKAGEPSLAPKAKKQAAAKAKSAKHATESSRNTLPETGSHESMMTLFYGVSLLTYAAYGLKKVKKS